MYTSMLFGLLIVAGLFANVARYQIVPTSRPTFSAPGRHRKCSYQGRHRLAY